MAVAATEDVTESRLLLAEYDRVKEEHKARIGFRDNLLYFTLAASTAVLAITIQSRRVQLLLAILVICLLLGWTYLVNYEKISAVGSYIRDQLGPRLAEFSGAHCATFGWEIYHRARCEPHHSQATTDHCGSAHVLGLADDLCDCIPVLSRRPAITRDRLPHTDTFPGRTGLQFLRYAER